MITIMDIILNHIIREQQEISLKAEYEKEKAVHAPHQLSDARYNT